MRASLLIFKELSATIHTLRTILDLGAWCSLSTRVYLSINGIWEVWWNRWLVRCVYSIHFIDSTVSNSRVLFSSIQIELSVGYTWKHWDLDMRRYCAFTLHKIYICIDTSVYLFSDTKFISYYWLVSIIAILHTNLCTYYIITLFLLVIFNSVNFLSFPLDYNIL